MKYLYICPDCKHKIELYIKPQEVKCLNCKKEMLRKKKDDKRTTK